MKTIYKTAEEIERDKSRKWVRVQYFIVLWFFIILSVILFGKLAEYSIKTEPEIKALKATIQACEARPPCKRELHEALHKGVKREIEK
jgi:hypothetical protein